MVLSFSEHALLRMRQRNVTEEDVRFIVQYGRHIHRAGAIFCQMLQCNMPDYVEPNSAQGRLAGTTVVLCRCGRMVSTVYRNPQAFKRDRSKSKYGYRRGPRPCPFCEIM